MGSNSSKPSRFFYRIVVPVILAVTITVGTIAGFVVWATAKSDARALQRETHLVSKVIAQQVQTLVEQQDYYSNWDEAVTALKDRDLEWIDNNLASDLYSNEGFDRVYLLDSGGAPFYAMYEGGRTTPDHFEADRPVIAPMVAELQAINAAGALSAYDAGNRDTVPGVADIAVIDRRLAYVGITAMMSDSGEEELLQLPGKENFVVCVRFLDSALTADFADQYFIENPAFTLTSPLQAESGAHPLTNKAGETVGWFTWQPDRPGAQILSETLPAMIGGLAIAGVVLVLLLRGLRRTTRELEDGKARAEYQANHDVLTGLANRAHFNKRLEEALAGSPRDDSSIALLALDLDRFKQVNDTLGHEAGDQLLCEVGRRLTPLVEEKDTVARLGGDEFAIIRRGVRTPGDVNALSDRIIAELGAPFVLAGRVAQIGVSIGAVITPASQAARDLASKADIALYEAKASGRNTYRIFDDGMRTAAEYREQVVGEMRAAHLPEQKVA